MKPKTNADIEGQYIGLSKVHRTLKPLYQAMQWTGPRYDGKNFDKMYMTSFIQRQIDQSWDVHVAPTNNGWLEVDSATGLEFYHRPVANGTLARFYNIQEPQA